MFRLLNLKILLFTTDSQWQNFQSRVISRTCYLGSFRIKKSSTFKRWLCDCLSQYGSNFPRSMFRLLNLKILLFTTDSQWQNFQSRVISRTCYLGSFRIKKSSTFKRWLCDCLSQYGSNFPRSMFRLLNLKILLFTTDSQWQNFQSRVISRTCYLGSFGIKKSSTFKRWLCDCLSQYGSNFLKHFVETAAILLVSGWSPEFSD